jgi:hypothetical protein
MYPALNGLPCILAPDAGRQSKEVNPNKNRWLGDQRQLKEFIVTLSSTLKRLNNLTERYNLS